MNMDEFREEYYKKLRQGLEQISAADFEKVANMLLDAWEQNKQVFIFGNGGSAATATHFACDLGKGTIENLQDPQEKRFRVLALNDNMSTFSAIANDLSYENVFAQQLRNLVEEGDVVIGISASGNSPNVIKAFQLGKAKGAKIIGFVGFDGGKMKPLCDAVLYFPEKSYQRSEDAHHIFQHLLMLYICEKKKEQKTSKEKKQMLQAVILDRDGVLIKEGGFIYKASEVEFYPKTVEALQLLKGKKIIIITNQGGIAKGVFREADYKNVREYIHKVLRKNGIEIAAEYYCPHHPEGTIAPYNVECSCRKPETGLFQRAIKEHQLDPSTCWTIGDMRRDIVAGQRVGMRGILVKTGFAGKGGSGDEVTPNYIAEDLYDAIKFIQQQEKQ